MNSICKVAALKVQYKQRYRLLKIRKFNAYKNDSIGTIQRVLYVTNPYICINPPFRTCKKGH